MRIGELARQAGVAVPTIKYYAREGLLSQGVRTSPNQVQYTEAHVRRLRLIRAMLDVGGLSIAAVREVLAEVDSPGRTMHSMLGVAQAAVSRVTTEQGNADDRQFAERVVAELVQRHGWVLKADGTNPGVRMLVQIVATYRALGQDELLCLLDRYAAAADQLAVAELDTVGRLASTDDKIEGVVLGTLLGDAAMSALRRIAQEGVSQRLEQQQEPHPV